MTRVVLFVLVWIFGTPVFPVFGENVRIAVATNFLSTLNKIVTNFEQDTGHAATISSGSSGKLYAQIRNGAPFDVFLSADGNRPELLEKEGVTIRGSRFTYAVGRLTLWSADPQLIKGDGKKVLQKGGFSRLAMANPKTAPYGAAAKSTLQALGLWDRLKPRIVQGENIGQTFQFVFSQNAELGFVARSQAWDPRMGKKGSRWDVPTKLYEKLSQQAVLLEQGKHNKSAQAFLDYVKGPKARTIIEGYGYGIE